MVRPPVVVAMVLALAPVSALPLAAGPDDPLADPNEAVLAFARDCVGDRVGDGECTTLVVEAFRVAGARRFPPFGPDADYVWGVLVEDRAEVRPGDVLQFRDARFRGSRRVVRNGRKTVERWRRSYPHHTAIVEEVRDGGRVLVVLHQNTGPDGSTEEERRVVRRDTLRLTELQKGGWVKAYRPVMEMEPPESLHQRDVRSTGATVDRTAGVRSMIQTFGAIPQPGIRPLPARFPNPFGYQQGLPGVSRRRDLRR